MIYEKFLATLVDEVKKALPKTDVTVREAPTRPNEDALFIAFGSNSNGICVYPKDIYRDLGGGDLTKEAINRIADDIAERAMKAKNEKKFNLEELISPENIKKNVFIRAINKSIVDRENGSAGKGKLISGRRYGDVVEILSITVHALGENVGITNLREEMVANIDHDELWHWARENTVENSVFERFETLFGFPQFSEEALMLVLTNKSSICGAGSLFVMEDKLRKYAKKVNDDLILIPSSTAEFLVVRRTEDKTVQNRVKSILLAMNKELSGGDFLSDMVFVVNKESGQIYPLDLDLNSVL